MRFFSSNARLKWAKNEARDKQHPKTEVSLFEKLSLSLPTLSSKNNERYSKKIFKKQVRLF